MRRAVFQDGRSAASEDNNIYGELNKAAYRAAHRRHDGSLHGPFATNSVSLSACRSLCGLFLPSPVLQGYRAGPDPPAGGQNWNSLIPSHYIKRWNVLSFTWAESLLSIIVLIAILLKMHQNVPFIFDIIGWFHHKFVNKISRYVTQTSFWLFLLHDGKTNT